MIDCSGSCCRGVGSQGIACSEVQIWVVSILGVFGMMGALKLRGWGLKLGIGDFGAGIWSWGWNCGFGVSVEVLELR